MTVTIRPVEPGDLQTLYEHQSDPVALEMAVFGARDREAFMKHWERIWSDPSNLAYAALVDDVVAGNVMVWSSDGLRYGADQQVLDPRAGEVRLREGRAPAAAQPWRRPRTADGASGEPGT